MQTVFDIGMYDGLDTAYYLESGFRVVAVEANAQLVAQARERFATHLASGQLHCVHAALSDRHGPVTLNLAGTDLGSSSIFAEQVAGKRPIGQTVVEGVMLGELMQRHGVPQYMKVDIEGADRYAILALTPEARPPFVSFEIGNDAGELLQHLQQLGYRRFKVINQNTFRELANYECLRDRIGRRLLRTLGYAEPQQVRRAGRFFQLHHSAGPVPWLSDGRWRGAEETQHRLARGGLPGWNDLHASID